MSSSNGHGGARRGAGRPPLPAEDHVLRGTWRADRHGPLPRSGDPLDDLKDEALAVAAVDDEPELEIITPAYLSPSAASFFTHLSPWIISEYGEGGCATRIEILVRACELMDTATKAREVLQSEGLTFTTETGMIRQRPEIAIQRDAIAEIRNCFHSLDVL